MTHSVCHSVTDSVSHRCPDQTRPDQSSYLPVWSVTTKTKCLPQEGQPSGRVPVLFGSAIGLGV